MGMNPNTNRFEQLISPTVEELLEKFRKPPNPEDVGKLLRPDGTPVPDSWSIFKVGEKVIVKNYTFKVGYIGESTLLLEPVGPVIVGDDEEEGK